MVVSGIINENFQNGEPMLGSIVAEGSTCVCSLRYHEGGLCLCKTLKTQFAHDEVYQRLFNKEYEVGSTLDCPYIVKYLNRFEANGRLQLLIEYVEGHTLQQTLETNPEWFASRSNILKFMRQLLLGLLCMHENQVVHLDISLANIMLTGINHDVRIIDLGYCYSPSYPSPIGTTAHYGAPELHVFGAHIDARADVYSFGKLMQDVISVAYPSSVCKISDIQQIVGRCCEDNPADRYQTAEEVLEQVELLRNKSNGGSPKSQKPLWIFLLFVVSLIVGVVLYFLLNQHEGDGAQHSPLAGNIEVQLVDTTAIADQAEFTPSDGADDSDTLSQQKQSALPVVKIAGNVFNVNGISFRMIPVAGGTFKMGNSYGSGVPYENGVREDEVPVHNVTLSNFMICETEITQELWCVLMDTNPSYYPQGNNPVENVTWHECLEFIAKLNSATGRNFRLPTEAEWEYAARGGKKSQGYFYSGSNDIDAVAWYRDNSNATTHPVKTKCPNELGIYDMSGNVWEWTSDCAVRYNEEDQVNPTVTRGSGRVIRGGAWSATDDNNVVSNRSQKGEAFGSRWLGFRLVLADK